MLCASRCATRGIFTCRALRANAQYTAKRLSELRAKQAHKRKGLRAFRRLQRRKSWFLAKQKRRARDMEHKISRAVVRLAKERQVSTIVISDVRDVADGKRLNTKSQQKIGFWSHGRQRSYITYTNVFACQEVQPEGKHIIRFP